MRGLCTRCGIRDPIAGRKQCGLCCRQQDKYRDPAAASKQSSRLTDSRLRAGLCPRCGKHPPKAGRAKCQACLLSHSRYVLAKAADDRENGAVKSRAYRPRGKRCAGWSKSGLRCAAFAKRGGVLCVVHQRLAML